MVTLRDGSSTEGNKGVSRIFALEYSTLPPLFPISLKEKSNSR